MNLIWWTIFLVSVISLIYVVIKAGISFRFIKYLIINMGMAALVVYLFNVVGIWTGFTIPINLYTILIITVLGVPGLVVISVLKLFVI